MMSGSWYEVVDLRISQNHGVKPPISMGTISVSGFGVKILNCTVKYPLLNS